MVGRKGRKLDSYLAMSVDGMVKYIHIGKEQADRLKGKGWYIKQAMVVDGEIKYVDVG